MRTINTKLLVVSMVLAAIIIAVVAQSVIRQQQQNHLHREITRALGTSRSNPQTMQAVLKNYEPRLADMRKHPPLCRISYPYAAASGEIDELRTQVCDLLECIAIGPCHDAVPWDEWSYFWRMFSAWGCVL
jgi:uncharacterized protein HemX